MNIVILKGRLTKDPEIKTTTNETKVCTFSIAVNRRFSKENEADFINCTAWRQTAEFIHKYFKKGQEICINGSLQVRKWEDKDGNTRRATDVVVENAEFCGSKKDNQTNAIEGDDTTSLNIGGDIFEVSEASQDELPF